MVENETLRRAVIVSAVTAASLGMSACADAAPRQDMSAHVRIDDGALKLEASRPATAAPDCFDSVRGKLGRMLNNMGQLAAGAIETGSIGSVTARVHQYDSRFRLTLTDKTLPNLKSYVVYPEGQYGQPLTSTPLKIGNIETQKSTGKQNEVIISLDPRTGKADLDADFAYGDYTQDPDSLDADIDTKVDSCAEADSLPAGMTQTVNFALDHVKYGSVFTSLKLQ